MASVHRAGAATLSCSGTLDKIDRLMESPGIAACAGAAARAVGEITGQVDLAKLAAILPGTLRIRDGTKIESGQINLRLANRPNGEHWAATGRIETTRLVANDRGRQIAGECSNQLLQSREATGGCADRDDIPDGALHHGRGGGDRDESS